MGAKKKVVKKMKRRTLPQAVAEEAVGHEVTDEEMNQAVERLGEIKTILSDFDTEYTDLRKKVHDGLKERGQKTWDAGGARATYKAPQRTIIDEDALKKRLGSKLWEKVTTKALDINKLKAFIASKEIDAALVASCSHEEETTSYVEIRKA